MFNSTDATSLSRRVAIPRLKKHELGNTVRYKAKRGFTPRFLAMANSTTVNEMAIIHKQK
jgi:hypothetical protein